MKGFINEYAYKGFSCRFIERKSGLTFATLKKIDCGRRVRATSLARLRMALDEINEKVVMDYEFRFGKTGN